MASFLVRGECSRLAFLYFVVMNSFFKIPRALGIAQVGQCIPG
jgi:hypothetical protein